MRIGIEAKQSQAEYFQANGTLKGWTGSLVTMDDFNKALDEASTDSGRNKTARERIDELP